MALPERRDGGVINVADVHMPAFRQERIGDGQADTTGGAGQQCRARLGRPGDR